MLGIWKTLSLTSRLFFFPAGEEIRPNSPKTGLLASPANKAYLRNITESIYLYIRFDFSSLSFFGGFLAA